MYEAVESFPSQPTGCAVELSAATLASLRNVQRLICCGMGGSAFPMEIIRAHIDCPVEIHRDYGDTLKIEETDGALYLLLSFSGNTEEVLDCAERLLAVGAQMLVITNGGKLSALARQHGLPKLGFPKLPDDFQPRCATGYFLGLVFSLTDQIGLTERAYQRLTTACNWLQAQKDDVLEKSQGLKKVLSRDAILLLSYPPYSDTIGQIGRIKLNENAKALVHVGSLPEFNHNQMEAACAVKSSLGVVLLCAPQSFARKTLRLQTTARFFERLDATVEMVTLKGESELAATLYGLWLLDFASLYVAEAQALDPMSIESIESFKMELKSVGGAG